MESLASLPGEATGPPPAIAGRCGVEQEYYAYRGNQQVDFRQLIHGLAIPGARIDPGDRNAYRLHDGSLITADGTEAEFATVPVDALPGFAGGIAALADELHQQLRALTPPDITLFGAATHINVSVPASLADRLVLEYPRVFGPALQALWDRPWGEGIMLRPRPGRVEFGGEFIAGGRLAAVALFCCASIRVLAAGAAAELPRFQPRLEPTGERLGIQFRRDAYGAHFYARARRATLVSSRGPISLEDALARAVDACSPALAALALPEDRALLSGIVAGGFPLGIEGGSLPALPETAAIQRSWTATPLEGVHSPGGKSFVPAYDTWDYTLFEVGEGPARWFVSVPRPRMASFREATEAGRLDSLSPEGAPTLSRRSQLFRPGVFTHIADMSVLAPAERAPGTRWFAQPQEPATPARSARPAPPTAGPATRDRPGKWIPSTGTTTSGGTAPEKPGQPFFQPRILIGLLLVLLIGVGIAITIAVSGGGDEPARADDPPSPSPAGAGVSPSAQPGTGNITPTPTQTSGTAAESPTTAGASESPPAGTSQSPAAGTSPAPSVSQPSGGGSPSVPAGSPGTAATPTPTSAIAATATPTTAIAPTPTATNTSLPAVLSGNRSVNFQVSANPGSHPCPVGPAMEVHFLITRAGPPEPGVPITITVSGPGLPTMTGNKVFGQGFDSQGGSAFVSGVGQYCGFTTTYEMTFTISPGGVSGTLVVGGDGALPGGQPISFSFSGGSPH